jgi:hypothetical protein
MAGVSLNAFNSVCEEWLSQIRATIPLLDDIEEIERNELIKKVEDIREKCSAFIKSRNPQLQRKPMEIYMGAIGPFRDKIFEKDEDFWHQQNPFFSSIGLQRLWNLLPPESKEGMWEFMKSLLLIGGVILSIPEEMLSMVDSMAEKMLQSKFLDNPDHLPDPSKENMLAIMDQFGSMQLKKKKKKKKDKKKI